MADNKQHTHHGPLGRIARIIGWTIMGVVLFVAAILIAIVNVLSPDKLTPLATKVASEAIEADIQSSRIEFSLLGHMPFLRLDIDSLVVLPRTLDVLTPAEHQALPAWADTLADVRHFHGSLNITSLMTGTIDMSDIAVHHATLNLVAAQHGVTNFEIIKSEKDEKSDSTVIPSIRIDQFTIVDPGPIRYYSAEDSTKLIVQLTTAELVGNKQPAYRVNIQSNLQSEVLSYLNRNDLAFGINGAIVWDQDSPNQLQLNDFYLGVDSIQAYLNTNIDFQNALTVNTLDVDIKPLAVDYLLTLLPDDVIADYDLGSLDTDAALDLGVKFNAPYEVGGKEVMPQATLSLAIPDCYVHWGQFRFGEFATQLTATTHGDDLNQLVVDVADLRLRGEHGGVGIGIKGTLTNLLDDPEFDGDVEGKINLASLPPIIERKLQAEISGNIDIAAKLHGRYGWLALNDFNKIHAEGTANLRKVYYAAWDTASMYYVNQGKITFGTDKQFVTPKRHVVKDMLAVSLEADSIAVLESDFAMNVTQMRAGIGALNTPASADTTQVNPIGGTLKFKSFNFNMLTDSAGVRVRDIKVFATMRRYKKQGRVPQFFLNIDAGLIGAGAPDARLLLRKSHIDVQAHLLPPSPGEQRRKARVDSLRRQFPNLSPDSIYALALRRHYDHANPNFRRFREVENEDSLLRLDMETSRGLKKLLRRWDLSGHVSAERAGFFTAYFPLRNRMKNFNLTFSTDSISFSGLEYKAGHSDFTIAGRVTNMKRSMLSDMRVPVRFHFDMASDTIDVNQLSEAIFRGAAYGEMAEKQRINLGDVGDDDQRLQDEINHIAAQSDSTAAFVIPVNIDAELNVRAKNILYSDILFKDLRGSVLAYDGALNLHRLVANSEMGSVNLNALYAAPNRKNLKFSFALDVNDFNIKEFYRLVPAVDTLMPILKDFAGIIDANIACTTALLPNMDIDIPTLQAIIKLQGDSLVFLDSETFKTLAKWLLFKNKSHNMIDHLAAEMAVQDGELQLFPFIFDFDRYRLGVFGYNDLAMNYNFHIGVLKSPLPFKFGINIKGDADDYKVRLGRCKFKPGMEAQRVALADTMSINLVREIQNVFRRGVRQAKIQKMNLGAKATRASDIDLASDTLTHADSLYLMREGLIPVAPAP